ncbi:cysteine hydrolase family protein [Acinetobacter puyangensis]|uniref:cysteine hydrolase family protein n=1 Tax=Acinetobacter puyangensis TaxID=1096779 RepID=UPI003A4E4163
MSISPLNTALLIIDMQRDFCQKGGYADSIGLDINLLRKPIFNINKLLKWARNLNMLVIHTREGHRADLTDLPIIKRERTLLANAEIGHQGPLGKLMIRGEYGHDFIDELQPISGEPIIDKPGYSAFAYTDLELILRNKEIKNLIITGITTEVCVSSTFRHATDLGFYCITVADACASANISLHQAALEMIKVENGIFGILKSTDELISLT